MASCKIISHFDLHIQETMSTQFSESCSQRMAEVIIIATVKQPGYGLEQCSALGQFHACHKHYKLGWSHQSMTFSGPPISQPEDTARPICKNHHHKTPHMTSFGHSWLSTPKLDDGMPDVKLELVAKASS